LGAMAKSFIHHQTVKGLLYASVYTPRKVNGKKDNQPLYLGRVIDKERGLYRSKERGLFKYTLEDGFINLSSEIQAKQEERLILDFGDAFVLSQILRDHGYWDLFRSILPGWEDTLCTMVAYRVLRGGASRYAHDWWTGSYMRLLCPEAKVQSQRVSEFFLELGDERTQRRFFQRYLAMVSEGQKNHGILVDSTGLPNDIDFHLTATNNHNGVVSDEVRLILAVDRMTKLPLLFRYNAGNIVDVSTLKSTILELSSYGVNIDFSILDAGYYSEKNINTLYADGIRFITRLCSNRKLYKALVAERLDGLESSRNAVFYRDRLLYFKKVATELCGHGAYAYIAIDQKRRAEEVYSFMRRLTDAKHKDTPDEIDRKTKGMGVFVILSSENVDVSEILPLYYMRQTIEQVFDIYKNNGDLLPLRSHGEETFRGHLMLSFISTITYMLVNKLLEGSKFCAEGAFRVLQNQKCKVFDNSILIKEPVKKANEIANHLKIDLPLELPLR
jgi:hypothetical protein